LSAVLITGLDSQQGDDAAVEVMALGNVHVPKVPTLHMVPPRSWCQLLPSIHVSAHQCQGRWGLRLSTPHYLTQVPPGKLVTLHNRWMLQTGCRRLRLL